MKIKKADLDFLLTKVMIGVGNNKLIPMTSMLGINYVNGTLALSATDSINYINSCKYLDYKEEDFNFNICVEANLFSRLISKLTTDYVELSINDKTLNVVGNGSYNLPILLDDAGNFATFENKEVSEDATEDVISVQKLKDLKFYCEKSLSKNPENVALNGYYVDSKLGITTNRVVMTLLNEGFIDIPITLRKSFIDLVTTLNNDVIIRRWDNYIYASDGETEIFSNENCEAANFPIAKLQKSIDKFEFTATADISLKELASALDRLSIFVPEQVRGYILLSLEDGKLVIKEPTTNANEIIMLNNLTDNITWSGKIDNNLLLEQIRSFKNDNVKIHLGNTSAIKIEENNIVKVICLMN